MNRKQVWPLLPSLNVHENNILKVNATLETLEKIQMQAQVRLEFVNTRNDPLTNMDSSEQVMCILHLLNTQFSISQSSLLIPLIKLLLSTIENPVLCLSVCWEMLEKPMM